MKRTTQFICNGRNSLMTTILRDSLGGNCKTVMIANMSSDIKNYEETVTTARFA